MGGIDLPWALPLPYSQELCNEYARVGATVVDQTLEVYEQFLANPKLDLRTWKLIKQRGNTHIYYSRERNPPSAFHKPLPVDVASPQVRAQADWSPMIKLLVTGTTRGSVDDAIYGAVSTTELTALMKSMAIQDEFYQTKTLRHIQLPTADDPFTYVGLRWNARGSYIASLIKARDRVFVECSGFREIRINGAVERVGYVCYHSVDLPEVAPLRSHGMLRAKFSACVLLRQQSPGVVDVFSTTAVRPGGDILFKVQAFKCAEVLIAVCNLTESAMKKKLVWMQAARAYGMPNATSPYMPRWRAMRQSFSDTFNKLTCEQCARELKALSKTTKCEICGTHVCSRCITTSKLVFGYAVEELEYRATPTCKGCITTARNMDNSKALAVYEFVQPFDNIRESYYIAKTTRPYHQRRISLDALSLSTSETPREACEDETSGELPPSTKTSQQFEDELTRERLRLWDQINGLCVQAEETYRLAVRQTHDMQQPAQYDEL